MLNNPLVVVKITKMWYNILSKGTIDLDEWLSDKNKQDEGPTLVKKTKKQQ